jgi:hypothetical protein
MAHGLVTPTEATWLSTLKSRKMAVNSARRFGGRRAAWSVRRFTMAVVELAYVRDRIDRGRAVSAQPLEPVGHQSRRQR